MINSQNKHSLIVSQGRCVHEGCKSSDAYTIYSDGSTYCYSCSRYTAVKKAEYRGEGFSVRESVNTPPIRPFKERRDIDYFNCPQLYQHLRQYIEDEEIDRFFFYSPLFQRYVFAHDEDGEPFYESRGTPNRVPKSLQEGTKPTFIFGKVKETGIVVVVEDLISAIKVSRYYGVLPLFGSFMSKKQQAALASIPNLRMVVMWLDADKYSLGMQYAKDQGMLIHSVAVHTDKDPKAYGKEPICYVVDHALSEMESLYEQDTK